MVSPDSSTQQADSACLGSTECRHWGLQITNPTIALRACFQSIIPRLRRPIHQPVQLPAYYDQMLAANHLLYHLNARYRNDRETARYGCWVTVTASASGSSHLTNFLPRDSMARACLATYLSETRIFDTQIW